MAKRLHILGICGTFMGGVAALARSLGYQVTGWDQHVYPPMSTQLEKLGIELSSSLSPADLPKQVDLFIIGNALSRGNPLVEYILTEGLPFQSGPQWLGEQILRNKRVLAVAGTHGKTTTASMLVHILEQTGQTPSFLVGGVVKPFELTARLTDSPYFVIEADEYDTAFFDKRSKFVHYFPDVFAINNLEFDHADIFPNLAAIQTQFAHGIRLVPQQGSVIAPQKEPAIAEVLAQGCWSSIVEVHTSSAWHIKNRAATGDSFELWYQEALKGTIRWSLLGEHNQQNALVAVLAAHQVGISIEAACQALANFTAPARRLEELGGNEHIKLYDDFAHHPTAIRSTLEGLRAKLGEQARIIAIFEPRSNTMKAGVHQGKLVPAFAEADKVYALQPLGIKWQLQDEVEQAGQTQPWEIHTEVHALASALLKNEKDYKNAHWVVMSNGGFEQIQTKLLNALVKE